MKMKNIFYLVLSLFLTVCSLSLQAQSFGILKGAVSDNISNEIIVGATIYDLADITHGAVSDFNGNFELRLKPGTHKIVCSFVSMKSDTITVSSDTSTIVHNFHLRSSAIELQTMVISAGKYEQNLNEITVSMEVIKPTLIENKNSANIKGALEQAPGLNILDGEPQIRGGSGFNFGIGSRVAILIDGLPALAGDGGRPDWNFIPVENVEQIEIIKGASSVTYGSSALSGSINMRTAYPTDIPLTKASVSTGMYDAPSVAGTKWWNGVANFSNASFLHSEKIKQLDLVIGGMAIYDHGFIGPPAYHPSFGALNDTTTKNNAVGLKTGRFNFNLRYRPKNISGLNYGINGNFMKSANNISLIWDNDTTGLYRAFPNTITLQEQTVFYLDPFINFSKGGIQQSIRTRYFYTKNSVVNNPSNETQVAYSEYQITKQFEKLGGLNMTGGIIMNQTFSHSRLDSVKNDNHLQNYAYYVQLDKKFWKILNLSVGFRDEYFKMNSDKIVGKPIFRSGLNLQLAKATFVRYSYGQGYRYPTITEKYISSQIGGLSIFPNPQLLPESSWNTEIGLKQGFKINNFKGFIDVAAFWQEYQNTIEFTFGAWNKYLDIYGDPAYSTGFKYLNTGSTRVKGLEVSLPGEGKVSKDLKIDILAGYTYILPQALDPKKVYFIDSTQRPLSFNSGSTDTTNSILKYRFQHIAKIDLQLTYKIFSIGGDWRYYSFVQNIDKTFYDFESQMHSGLEKYRKKHNTGTHLFDARIGCNVTKQFKVAFVVNNLMNLSYSLRPLKIESPRTFALQLSLKL